MSSNTETTEDQSLRADCYLFLAGLLDAAPAQQQLQGLAQLSAEADSRGELADAWRALSEVAAEAEEGAVQEEFFALFVGLGRGELVPFGSWYLTGFLQEQPLADLRDSLAALGLAKAEGRVTTEDHIAQELAVMAALIADPASDALSVQQDFFGQHLAPWGERFFSDLQAAKTAHFYRAVGQLGLAFMRFEKQYLQMPS